MRLLDTDEWNKRYRKAIKAMQQRMTKVKGVVAAFNTNIDAVIRLKSGLLNRILNDATLAKKVLSALEKPSGEIVSVEDLFVGLLESLRTGIAEEWMIRNRNIVHWLESTFRDSSIRMGGQAGIIANTLAKLGISNVIAHASSLPVEQTALFLQNVKIPVRKNKKIVFERPKNATRPFDEKMVHYVFDFQQGIEVTIEKTRFKSPRANKFVATWDPRNSELQIDRAFSKMSILHIADRAAISGYHLLRSEYEDGCTIIDKIMPTVELLRKWKEGQADFFIHLETGDSKYEEAYASALKMVTPQIDSIGLNENELVKLSSALGFPSLEIEELYCVVNLFETAIKLRETLMVPIILIHTMDFTFCISNKARMTLARAEAIQDGIFLGASLAAARAITSNFNDSTIIKKDV